MALSIQTARLNVPGWIYIFRTLMKIALNEILDAWVHTCMYLI